MGKSSKEELINAIKGVCELIMEHNERLNLKDRLLIEWCQLEDVEYSLVNEAWKWLNNIYYNEFYYYRKTWGSQTPKQWSDSKLFDLDESHEWSLLNKKIVTLRKTLVHRDRPMIFKKTKLAQYLKKRHNERQKSKTRKSPRTKNERDVSTANIPDAVEAAS